MPPRFVTAAAAAALAALAALAAAGATGLRFNASSSLAPGLYLTRTRPIERGEIVVVCLPEVVSRWARGRGYLDPGPCPGRASRVGKGVAAVGGDVVELSETGLSVNGEPLDHFAPAERDGEGRPVPLVPPGERTLAPDEIWLHSPHRRSLDSRVFGPLDVSRVESVIVPLFSVQGD